MQQQGWPTVSPGAKYLKGSQRGRERRGGMGVGEEARVWNEERESRAEQVVYSHCADDRLENSWDFSLINIFDRFLLCVCLLR